MKESTRNIFLELLERYPALVSAASEIEAAFELVRGAYEGGGKLLCGGNGGSACDCEHIVGELLKSFKKPRAIDCETKKSLLALGEDGEYLASKLEGALPAVSLVSQTGVLTAYANDRAWDAALAQQVYGLGNKGDVLLVLSTSGNSRNCVLAARVAEAKGLKTIALTGEGGGMLKDICDVCIAAPERETYKVQELHLPIYHALCAMLEEEFFSAGGGWRLRPHEL